MKSLIWGHLFFSVSVVGCSGLLTFSFSGNDLQIHMMLFYSADHFVCLFVLLFSQNPQSIIRSCLLNILESLPFSTFRLIEVTVELSV